MKLLIAAVAAGMWLGGAEPSSAQHEESTPEVIRVAVQSVAAEHAGRGRAVMQLPDDDEALASAISAANTGLPVGPSKDVMVCTSVRCRIVGGDVAIAIEPPVVEGRTAEVRVWVSFWAGVAKEIWLIKLARRGNAWFVAEKELVLQT